MGAWRRELKTALRSLARSPSFTLAALACLAVGLGAAIALFAVAHAVVLSPLPFDEPDELVVVLRDLTGDRDGGGRGRFSAAEYLDLAGAEAFAAAGAMVSSETSLTGRERPERLVAGMATPALLSTLGIEPPLGRGFTEDEGRPGQDGVAILSHALWQRRFDGSDRVLGETVRLDGRPYTVIGVLPERADFELDDVAHDLWLPLPVDPAAPGPRRLRGLAVVARLAPESSLATARAELTALKERWWQDHPGDYADEEWQMSVTPLAEEMVGDSRTALLAAFGVSGLVWLIACANVAHLVLARSLARQRDTALRSALGAGRGALALPLVTEGLLLGLGGAALGLALAAVALRALVLFDPGDLPRLGEITFSPAVWLFALAATAGSVALFAVLPALEAARSEPAAVLQAGGRGSSAGTPLLRGGLVVAEVALGTLVLIGAGLLLQSYLSVTSVDPGFEPEGRLAFELALPLPDYPEPAQRIRFANELVERLEALPGVRRAGATTILPMHRDLILREAEIENPSLPPEESVVTIDWRLVTPGYFEAAGLELVDGRGFDPALDGAQGAPAVIVDQATARRAWPGESPLGRRVRMQGGRTGWRTVVGVVAPVRLSGLKEEAREQLYTPYAQTPLPFLALVVETAGEPMALAAEVREAVWSLDRNLPVHRLRPLTEIVAESVAAERFYAALLAVFALVSALLVAIGLYGVVAYAVAHRTRELGIRMALGETRRSVLRDVLRRGTLLAVVGVLLGVLSALSSTRLLGSLLYGVEAFDLKTFVSVSLALLVLAVLSSLPPALRATRIDPVVALKEE